MDRLTETKIQNEAFDIGYQTCLHDNQKMSWDTAEELQRYRQTGLTPTEVSELAQAKVDGLLVVLPCKLGTTVYEAMCKRDNRDCHYVLNYTFSWRTYTAVTEALHRGTLFYTRKEAEDYISKQGLLTPSKRLRTLDRMEGME